MIPEKRLPYPGLRAFTRDESDLFFGREGCVNAMVDRFAATRFLAVLGPSGGGKSSLVRTGFQDALDLGIHPWAGSQWKVADMHPGGQPMHNLAAALLSVGSAQSRNEVDVELLTDFLARGPRSVVEWASGGNLEAGWNLLIMVDQFEELFRYSDYAQREEAEAFVALLIESAAAPKSVPVHIVLTMRSEYLGACALISGLAERINAGLYLTPRMGREECREAIEGPADVIGFTVEPKLVNRLLNDLGSFAPWEAGERVDQAERISRQADQLPVMQHVLNRLWVRAEAESNGSPIVLRLSDYDEIGGLSGALEAHGREVTDSLGPECAASIETIFRALISGPTTALAVRRPTRLGELVELTGKRDDVIAIVDAFRAQGCNFLRTSDRHLDHDDVIVDISHESLIRQWTPLREWLEKEARAAASWHRLVAAEEHYREGDGSLLSGPGLSSLEAFWETTKPTPAWAARHGGKFEQAISFLTASRNAEAERLANEKRFQVRERNRLRGYVGALAVALAIFAGLAFYSRQESKLAKLAAKRAETAEAKAKEAEVKAESTGLEATRKQLRAAAIIRDVSDTLDSDEYKSLLGFGPFRAELMQKLAGYQQDMSEADAKAMSQVDSKAIPELAKLRDSYRSAVAFESVGDVLKAKEAYARSYEEGKALIEQLKGKRPSEELEENFIENGYIYGWLLLDIGERERGGEVIATIRHLVGRFPVNDASARLLVDRGAFENLESRYFGDVNQSDQDRLHSKDDLDLAEKALSLPNPDLRTLDHAFWARHNYSLHLKGQERERMESKSCEISSRLMEIAPLDTQSIRAKVECLIDESDHADTKGDFKIAGGKLAEAHDILDHALMLSPKEQIILLLLAKIENSLGDLEYKELQMDSKASSETDTPSEVARRKRKSAAAGLLARAIRGRTVMQSSSSELKSLYANAKTTSFADGAELKFYLDVYDAMGRTLEAFPNSPSFSFIAADASANIARLMSSDANKANDARTYASKAIDWFERRGVTSNPKLYSEEYAAYCGAFEHRVKANAALRQPEPVLRDVARYRSRCLPILEHYDWDFYLRMSHIEIEWTTGKLMYDLKRYPEAIEHLSISSKWGEVDSSKLLAKIYADGPQKDEKKAKALEELAKHQSMKRFTIPCDFGGIKAPFYIYVRQWPAEYTKKYPGVDDQAKWLKEARGGVMPPEVITSFQKLQKIADDNNVSFVDLTVYALGTASQTEKESALNAAYKMFDQNENSGTLSTLKGAAQKRYNELVETKKQSDADAVDAHLAEATENLLKQTKDASAEREAWEVFYSIGNHRKPHSWKEARAAFLRSSQIAEILPHDNPDDLYYPLASYEELGGGDFQEGDLQGARDGYAKMLATARARFALAATSRNLSALRIASEDLALTLAKLKQTKDVETLYDSLADSTEGLLKAEASKHHVPTNESSAEAIKVYGALSEYERLTGDQAKLQTYLTRERKLAPMIAEGTPEGDYLRYHAFETVGDSLRTNGLQTEARASYLQSASALSSYIAFRTGSPERKAEADKDELYEHYGNLSWIEVLAGNFDKAIEAGQTGLKLKPEASYIEANMAHGLLLSGRRQEAIEHYMHVRGGKVGSRSLVDATEEDFVTLKQLGFADPDMDKILKQMRQTKD